MKTSRCCPTLFLCWLALSAAPPSLLAGAGTGNDRVIYELGFLLVAVGVRLS